MYSFVSFLNTKNTCKVLVSQLSSNFLYKIQKKLKKDQILFIWRK